MLKFKCADAGYYKQKFWTIDISEKAIYSIDIHNWKIEFISKIKNENGIQYRKILAEGSKLYFVLSKGIGIFEYDIETTSEKMYEMSHVSENMVIMGAVRYQNEIIIVPLYVFDKIYAFDINTYQFRAIACSLNVHCKTREETYVPSIQLVDHKLFFVTEKGRVLKSFDLQNNMLEQYLLCSDYLIGGICLYHDEFWLVSSKGFHVCKWKPETGVIEEYFFDEINQDMGEEDVNPCIISGKNNIYVLSVLGKGIYKINKKAGKVERIYSVSRDEIQKRKALFIESRVENNKIIVFPWGAENFVEIDDEFLTVTEHEALIRGKQLGNLLNWDYKNGDILHENGLFSLNDMQDMVCDIHGFQTNSHISTERQTIGSKIYKENL